MEENAIPMEIVNPHAAGIDIGSRSHWVAVGQQSQDVREFGVFNVDLFALADWLSEHQIKTVAMESTGTYWQNLYAVLIARGFYVILCNGKFTKNIKGKKTDIKDCQWIEKVKNTPHVNPEGYLFLDQKRKLGMVKRIQKQLDKFGLTNE